MRIFGHYPSPCRASVFLHSHPEPPPCHSPAAHPHSPPIAPPSSRLPCAFMQAGGSFNLRPPITLPSPIHPKPTCYVLTTPLPPTLPRHPTHPPPRGQPAARSLAVRSSSHTPPPATVCLSTVHDPLVMHVRSHVPVTCPFSGAGPSPPSTCCLGTARPRLPATSPRQVPSVSLSSPALCPCHLPVFCPSTAGPSVHCHLPSCHCTDAHRPTSFLPLAS